MERTRTFDLSGKKWRMDKINPLDGSNLLRMFTAAGNANPQEFLANMPSEQFKLIQRILLASVYLVKVIDDKEIPSPLFLPSGVMDVEGEDSGLLFMLTVISLMFNMSGFFGGDTLKEFQEIVKEFNV